MDWNTNMDGYHNFQRKYPNDPNRCKTLGILDLKDFRFEGF